MKNKQKIKTNAPVRNALAFSLAMASMAVGYSNPVIAEVDAKFYEGMEFRNVGPHRGGRVTAVEGVEGDDLTYYMGATGGGVWKTANAGLSWKNISDGFFGVGTIGAIDVAESDKNVIYVGTGAAPMRGVSASSGDGIYKSTDAGKTWTHVGLPNSRLVAGIQTHPTNPDLVYVAALGAAWGDSEDRGIYRSKDGGETWEKVLYVNETSGAVDIKMDKNNPRVLYASMWDMQRKPWEIRSGGDGSRLYKSTDGGDTWTELSKGLPDFKGKMGIAPSPANPDRVWAIVENREKGGLYRSDDAGESWKLVNSDRRLHARSWYYMHIDADPNDENTVYVMNSGFYKSINGGKSVSSIRGPHGDYHDMWINPDNSKNMISGNDGGGTVTFDGGVEWSSIYNQPTAQFYRVNADNMFPYRIYAGQQDNTTVAVRSRGLDGAIGRDDYIAMGGCESAHVAFDPDNPRFVYAGCYLGQIDEYDNETGMTRDVRVYPEIEFGVSPSERKYRFNWNAPITVSEHDPSVIYHAGNVLLKSTDRGESWTEVSPDLTRDDPATQGPMGRPITNEVSENYNTILYIEESPHDAKTIWAGADDGLLHITRDGGGNWEDVTPRGVKDGMMNAIEASPHTPGTAYVAYNRYKYNDHTPVIYKTTNYGKRWSKVAKGIADGAFVRVVREDTQRKDMLYAGTETGLYISYNGGKDWEKFQLNLPVVPITDIKVHGNDLVLSTQGRAFWVLEDLSALRNLTDDVMNADAHLFAPIPAFDFITNRQSDPGMAANPQDGAHIHYSLKEKPGEDVTVSLEILDGDKVIRTFDGDDVSAKAGMNTHHWDMSVEPIKGIPGVFTVLGAPGSEIDGYTVAPGTYTVRLNVGDKQYEQPLEVTLDPRSDVPAAAYQASVRTTEKLYAMADELNRSITSLRTVRDDTERLLKRADELGLSEDVVAAGKALNEAIDGWEDTVISPKREFFQDVLNWPNKLNARLLYLYATAAGDVPPLSAGVMERFEMVKGQFDTAISARDELVAGPLAAFNSAYSGAGLPALAHLPFTKAAE